jgi:hypothetical protein
MIRRLSSLAIRFGWIWRYQLLASHDPVFKEQEDLLSGVNGSASRGWDDPGQISWTSFTQHRTKGTPRFLPMSRG